MAQCRGTTKKGTRCRNQAAEGSEFCPVHGEQATSSRTRRQDGGGGREETAELLRTAFGFALVGAVVLWAMTRGR